jgi:predicted nucleic acid-binding protein
MARQKSPLTRSSDRLFLDTGYVIARFNRRDQHHGTAKRLAETVSAARELWTTDAVLLEVAAAFSHPDHRAIAIRIWHEFHGGNSRCHSCEVAGSRLHQAVELFAQRSDKAWSLTDCLSFVVMDEAQLSAALTADHHFIQAGFGALLLET